VLGFEEINGVRYDWYNYPATIPASTPVKSSSDTIKRVKDNSGNEQRYLALPFWNAMPFSFDTVRLFPAADIPPQASDIRLTLCPLPSRTVRLTGFLDSLPYANTVQWSTTSFPAIADASTGEINTANFPDRGTFTYSYQRFSECLTNSAAGKAYVHIPHGKIPTRRDTIEICLDQADAININSVFGLELGGSWRYPVNAGNVVSGNMTTTSLDALIFNGAKAYAQASDAVYDAGVKRKKFVFEYDYSVSGCVAGTKRIVIVIYEE
jgi:hypothetical protein